MRNAPLRSLNASAAVVTQNRWSRARIIVSMAMALGIGVALLPAFSGNVQAATVGQDSAGTSALRVFQNSRVGSTFTAEATGTSKAFRFQAQGGQHDQRFRAVIYATDGNGRPTSHIATSNEVVIKAQQARGWVTVPMSGVKVQSGSQYLLGVLAGGSTSSRYISYSSSSVLFFDQNQGAGYSAMNIYPYAPRNWSGGGSDNRRWAFVLDLEASATTTSTTALANTSPGNGTVKVNFQPQGAATPSGYSADTGTAFNGTSGWFNQSGNATSFASNTRERNEASDKRLDTFIHMQLPAGSPGTSGSGYWERNVANGRYSVTVGAGDPSFTDSRHVVTVEGQTAIDFAPSSSNKTSVRTITVDVNDGRLTVKATGNNTKLSYLDIAPATTPAPAPSTTTTTAAPTTTTTTATPSTTAPPATTPPAGNYSPVGGPGGSWSLQFNDDFNGSAINRAKFPECHWSTRPGCTGQNTNELQAYRTGNVAVSGGAAHLTAKRESVKVPELGQTLNYTSGSIATGSWNNQPSTYKMKYGYVEARIKTAPGKGLWSSLWMAPADMVWPPEIDILEAPNFSEYRAHQNIHYPTNNGRAQSSSNWTSSKKLTENYHVYGLEWTPTSLKWYIDGRLIRTFSDSSKVPQKDMYIVANLSVGGWAGTPSSGAFPSTMSIDYIRAWQR